MPTEIISLRGERHKTFDLGVDAKGRALRRAEFHCKPIHYADGWAFWQDIDCNIIADGADFLSTDKNRVKTKLKVNKQTAGILSFEDCKNGGISFSPLSIKCGGVTFADLSSPKTFTKSDQKSGNENRLDIKEGGAIEGYVNEAGARLWFEIPQPVDSFDIAIQVDLSGGLVCLNRMDGSSYIPDQYNRFNFGYIDSATPAFWIKPPYWVDSSGKSYQSVIHSLSLLGGILIYRKVSNEAFADDSKSAQYPIKVDVNTYYAETSDGYVYLSDAVNPWATVRSAATGTAASDSSTEAVAIGAEAASPYVLTRGFYLWTTSDLPDDATVTNAVASIYFTAIVGSTLTGVAQKSAWGTSLTTADYDDFSGNSYGEVTISTSAYNSWTVPNADVSLTGNTMICLREGNHDFDNVFPGTDYTGTARFSNYGGTTYVPKLVVDYIVETVETATLSIDALIQQDGRTATTGLDAAIQSTGNISAADIDAALQVARTAVANLDALVADHKAGVAADLDALIQTARTETASLDAALMATGLSETASLDATLQTVHAAATDLDALLVKVGTADVGIDAIVQGIKMAALSLDAALQLNSRTNALGLDAYIANARTSTAQLDALLQAIKATVVNLDALLQANDITASTSIDAAIMVAGLTQAVALDGMLQRAVTASCGIDAFIATLIAAGATVGLDACLITRTILNHPLNTYRTRFLVTLNTSRKYSSEDIYLNES